MRGTLRRRLRPDGLGRSLRIESLEQRTLLAVSAAALQPPLFLLQGPTSGAYQAGQDVAIQWTQGGYLEPGSKISLCYDPDTVFNGNERWIEIDGVTAAAGKGSFAWNTAGVTPGTYYVAGYLWDGRNEFRCSHLVEPITVKAYAPQTFELADSTFDTYQEGNLIDVRWTAGGVAQGSKVSLCYDTDTTFNGNEHWIEIDKAAAADGNGSYWWHTAGMAPGTYYLAGYLWNGDNTFTISHLSKPITVVAPVVPRTFSLVTSIAATDQGDEAVTITWTASGVAQGSKISLCYDVDTIFNGNEHWIEIDGVAAADGSGIYTWHTAGVDPSAYYVGGYLWDGVNGFAVSHLPQPVAGYAPEAPLLSLWQPGAGMVRVGDLVNIQWIAQNLTAEHTLNLCYDTDPSFNADPHWIEIDGAVVADGDGSYAWDTTGLAPGTYYVSARVCRDGITISNSGYNLGPINIGAALALTAPAYPPPASLPADAVLTSPDDLGPIVAAAIQRFARMVSAGGTVSIENLPVEIADLPGMTLAEYVGNKILIDRDAAGYGWFVDPTPADDAEFGDGVGLGFGGPGMPAIEGGPAAGPADLLSAVSFEMASVLTFEGVAEFNVGSHRNDVSGTSLSLGYRRGFFPAVYWYSDSTAAASSATSDDTELAARDAAFASLGAA
jgi:hypothetical protein